MRRSIPVLCYHAIDASADARGARGHPRARFERHLDLILERGFTTISASHLLDICTGVRPFDGKYIVLTFDDGHVSQWLYAAPLLSERRMTAAFFVVTDFIGSGAPRSSRSAPPLVDIGSAFRLATADGDRSQFMNAAELSALVRDHGMEVYSHSSGHQGCFRTLKRIGDFSERAHWTTWGIYGERRATDPVFDHGSAYAYNGYWPQDPQHGSAFRRRSDEERYRFCLEELRRSLERVAEINGADRQVLCWPWGEFDPIADRACRAAGFSGAFTLERGFAGPGIDPFRMSRIRVGRARSRGWLAARLSMFSTAASASAFSRRFVKKPETTRVLYVTDSTQLSGGSRQLLNNVAALSAMGVHVEVVAPPGSPVARALEPGGAPVIAWPHSRRIIRSARFLARITRARQVDVVHVFHSRPGKAAVLAKLLGGRFRLFLNRGVIHPPNSLIALFAVIADGVICNSHACARVLTAYGVPAARINVVYNSLAVPDSPPRVVNGNRVRILYVGNANPVKGFDVFLETARAYVKQHPGSPATFVSCGVPREAAVARRGCQETLSRVDMQGPVDPDTVLNLLEDADIFALTSRMESMPNVLLEAFSRSLPAVCTDVGGVGELVRDGVNGWLCPSEDVEGLARRLHELVEHPDRRLAMGAVNHRLATSHLGNSRKGTLLLRAYSGERVVDTIDWDQVTGPAKPRLTRR